MHLKAKPSKVVMDELCCDFEVISSEEDEGTIVHIEGRGHVEGGAEGFGSLSGQATFSIWEIPKLSPFCRHDRFKGFNESLHDEQEKNRGHVVTLLDPCPVVDVTFLFSHFKFDYAV